jgi:hypothetical protein
MSSPLSQVELDRLASSWSRLDQARPRERVDVPRAVEALSEWMACALIVDDGLAGFLGSAYLLARAEEAGGSLLLGLRHAAWFLERGHRLERMVLAGTGSPHEFWELHWLPDEELPAHQEEEEGREHQREAYRLHLAGRDVRTPAASMTTFLLSMAVAMASGGRGGPEES